MNNDTIFQDNLLYNTHSLKNNLDFEKYMTKIDELIKIPDAELTEEQAQELFNLSSQVQQYEQDIFSIEPPKTIEGIIEMKIYELHLKPNEMAKKLNVSNIQLEMIMNGIQKPDIYFIKQLHDNFNIDGNYLLSVI